MQSPGPVAFTIGSLSIRWYGILIAAGALLAVFISCRRAPKHDIDPERVLDVVIWSLPLGIVGARIYYVIFNWSLYQGNFVEMVNIREGGLAIHGGLIFGIITAYLVCRKESVPFLEMCDLVFPTVALAQSIGRWGNFFNSEAHGTETTLPWAILVDGKYVHPTFLYESIWCLFLFFFLIWFDNHHRKFPGQIACLYGMMYSVERFFVEALRTDSLMIGPFRQARVLSVCIFAGCMILYILLRNKNSDMRSEL